MCACRHAFMHVCMIDCINVSMSISNACMYIIACACFLNYEFLLRYACVSACTHVCMYVWNYVCRYAL